MVDNTSCKVVDLTAGDFDSDLEPDSIFSTAGFSNVVAGTQIINNSGSIYFQPDAESTLFGSLAAHDQHQDPIRLTKTILTKKSRLQTGRRVSVVDHCDCEALL